VDARSGCVSLLFLSGASSPSERQNADPKSIFDRTALFSARHTLSLSHASLSFTERWGGWIFFLAQSFACILESLSPLLTGRPFPRGGWFARLWGYAWVIGLGCLAGRCWIALGLVEGLPGVERWGWQRFLLPTTALAPPPVFTR
jgi:hypothetical protein